MLQSTASNNAFDKLGWKILEHVNNNLLAEKDCVSWELERVLEVRLLKPNDQLVLFKDSVNDVNERTVYFDNLRSKKANKDTAFYQVLLLAKPGAAIFEATIKANLDLTAEKVIVEGVSRVNKYGKQSHCISNHAFKPFCYCKYKLLKTLFKNHMKRENI